jgi:Beta protein
MILTSDMYVPAVRWRQGEYQALFRLSNRIKDRIMPFITIPEIEFDFEERRPKKSVQEHVHPFAARYSSKWEKRPAWVGMNKSIVFSPMDDGRDPFTYVFAELRRFEANAIPAIPLGADPATSRALAAIVKRDSLGAAISVRLEDLMRATATADVRALARALGVDLSEADLIVDLGAPSFEPYLTFAGALVVALRRLSDLDLFRNFVLIGTAIPETFKDIAKGFDEIPRHDWLFYQTLIAQLPAGMRRPNFGDYTVVHPEFAPVDMRKIKSAGKVIYTTPRNWTVHKGGAFRDNPAQMHDHCADLVKRPIFKGADYSSGDDYIAKCAVRKEGPSNQTRWKDVAINHHITHVLDDLSTFGDEP